MARRNQYDRYILSAGEIASYVVCPEAWRLKTVEKANLILPDNVREGNKLHKEWAAEVDEAMYFTRGTRVVLFLMSVLLLVFLATYFY